MMGAQHTPGPWHIGGKPQSPIIFGSDGFAVADATVFHGTFKEGQTEANANLIAAAPDLLEALETASWLLADISPDGLVKQKVDAAIAKAKGGAA